MPPLSLLAHAGHHHLQPDTTDALTASVIILFIFFTFIITLIVYVLHAYMLSRIFQKAGRNAWKAWIPVYNNWIFLEIGGQKGWWAVMMLIPIINIAAVVFIYIAMYHIGLKLRKEGAFVLLGIFLPLVWYGWLAFDSSTWKAKPVHHGTRRKVTPQVS
jgi:hypothetical protein